VPQAWDRVIVASVAARLGQAVEELLVRNGVEGVANGSQRGTVFQFAPSEERLGRVNQQERPPEE
jgi:hypothetical protein